MISSKHNHDHHSSIKKIDEALFDFVIWIIMFQKMLMLFFRLELSKFSKISNSYSKYKPNQNRKSKEINSPNSNNKDKVITISQILQRVWTSYIPPFGVDVKKFVFLVRRFDVVLSFVGLCCWFSGKYEDYSKSDKELWRWWRHTINVFPLLLKLCKYHTKSHEIW